jgi:hypothetical protein
MNEYKFFEFGVKKGELMFIENNDYIEEIECKGIVKILCKEKTIDVNSEIMGQVIIKGDEMEISTREYDQDFDWDFDHEQTKVVNIKL